jgi:predicted GIY-YIG superfamily endonuclease
LTSCSLELRPGRPFGLSIEKALDTIVQGFFIVGDSMNSMYYVYILQSQAEPERFYTGFTTDIEARIKAHNNGKCSYSAKYRPWKLKNLIGFNDREKAIAFEKYLKSSSGRAFARKRF